MTLLTAVLFLAQAAHQEPVLYPLGQDDVFEFFVRPRAGIWVANGFEFNAIRTDSVQVKTNEKLLYSAGLNVGTTIVNQFVVFASGEFS